MSISSGHLPGQPLDDPTFNGKTFTFINRAQEPLCIDIHRDEEAKSQPRIQAFNVNERYLNQIWLLRRENTGEEWSLQNVGTGFFLGQDDQAAGPLFASRKIEYLRPRLDSDDTILLFSTRGVATLHGHNFGPEVVTIPYGEEKQRSQIQWIFREYNLTEEELRISTEARKSAESAVTSTSASAVNGVASGKDPEVVKIAVTALSVSTGETVDDEATVTLLNDIGGCPAGFSWHRIEGGFKCGGGTHWVTDAELAEQS